MALQLMKLSIEASTSTTVSPLHSRFFYVTTAPTSSGATLTIDPSALFQDDGSVVTTLPTLTANNSYFNVYVNGLLQMEGISTYTPGSTGVGSLAITVPDGSSDLATGTPIILEIVQFTPASTTTITT
ncbi:DUF4183 domain-containing protein [Bacillus sp. SN10]|uniref:DUF4183 domain-containing protein n=1 Tax=Bacillus sp. SN10 TaxID=2056493 RepID=UPI000C33F1CA|nr:DUF4183 domain-containing protein [Bacillus sp. SN10]PKJ52045.1 hypothetical protein CWE34_30080 [Bacillus sp. SN10]